MSIEVQRKNITILGGGRFGRALARTAVVAEEFNVHIGSNSISAKQFEKECPGAYSYDNYKDPILKSSLIILAIPSKHVYSLVDANYAALEGKIVVDVSNPYHRHHSKAFSDTELSRLISNFPKIRFVKCFNTVSAHAFESYSYPVGFIGTAYICGDDHEANLEVSNFAQDLGVPVQIIGRKEKTALLENYVNSFLSEWRTALLIAAIVLVLIFIYTYIWNAMSSLVWWALLSSSFTTVFGGTALNLLAIVYLPGSIAQFIIYSSKRRTVILPSWLSKWLLIRKELGLLALLFIVMHFLLAIMTLNPGQRPLFYGPSIIAGDNFPALTVVNEIGMFLGVTAFGVGLILGVVTLPSIARTMSWREWHIIERYGGFLFLFLATAHVTVNYSFLWPTGSALYYRGVPPASLIIVCFPYLVIFVKFVVWIYIGFVLLFRRQKRSQSSARRTPSASPALQSASPPVATKSPIQQEV